MTELQQLSDLTSRIYDAAIDRSLWSNALEGACRYVGGSSANLFSVDTSSKRAAHFFQWGNDPAYEKLYLEKYYKLNPLFPALTFYDVGIVHSTSDIMPHEEFQKTRFYKEWVRPQGFVDALGVNLEKCATSSAVLAIRRHARDGLVDAEARRRFGLIAPHMRRAVLIGKVIDFHATTAALLIDTLQTLATGVFLVDRKGRLVFSNESGQALLDEGRILRSAQGLLMAIDPKANQRLADTFMAAANGGDAAVGHKGISIPLLVGDSTSWIAHVLPLTSGARKQAGVAHAAAAAVFVRKASLNVPSAMETVARIYRLTPSEIRVLNAMVEIGGVPATADALGVSESTIKTHLHNLFEKTGTHRQADLVKLVATSSSPLV